MHEPVSDEHREYDQGDSTETFGPREAAEEKPPQDDQQRADECSKQSDKKEWQTEDQHVGRYSRNNKPEQNQQHCGDYAGPETRRLSQFGWLRLSRGWFRRI